MSEISQSTCVKTGKFCVLLPTMSCTDILIASPPCRNAYRNVFWHILTSKSDKIPVTDSGTDHVFLSNRADDIQELGKSLSESNNWFAIEHEISSTLR